MSEKNGTNTLESGPYTYHITSGMYPAEWHSKSPSSKKKRARDEPIRASVDIPGKLDMDISRLILRNINTSGKAPATPPELNLDVVLSRVPYKNILENLFGRDDYVGRSVPVVSKSYEEQFMREALPGERKCAAGDMCECMMIDPTKPFVGTEYLLPNEEESPTPQFCVLCSRKVAQKLFYDVILTRIPFHGLIQRYGNICSVDGEYHRDCCLICPRNGPLHCMPDPIMSHQRNRYEVYISNGIKYLRQINVAHEEYMGMIADQPSSAFPCVKRLHTQPPVSFPVKKIRCVPAPEKIAEPPKKVKVTTGGINDKGTQKAAMGIDVQKQIKTAAVMTEERPKKVENPVQKKVKNTVQKKEEKGPKSVVVVAEPKKVKKVTEAAENTVTPGKQMHKEKKTKESLHDTKTKWDAWHYENGVGSRVEQIAPKQTKAVKTAEKPPKKTESLPPPSQQITEKKSSKAATTEPKKTAPPLSPPEHITEKKKNKAATTEEPPAKKHKSSHPLEMKQHHPKATDEAHPPKKQKISNGDEKTSKGKSDPDAVIKKTIFIPGHAKLNERVAELHCLLQRDESAQVLIDAHLPAAAAQKSLVKKNGRNNKLDAEYFVLYPDDTPQFRTLPDLGWLIREQLIGQTPNTLPYVSGLLTQVCLPSIKNPSSEEELQRGPCPAGCWILLNLLLATQLGLYPANVKRAPFHARVFIYTRIHAMLSSPTTEQRQFIVTHKSLFQMVVAEYVCHVIPLFLPSERDMLTSLYPAMDVFFAQGNVILDSFRQEAIDCGVEPWEYLCQTAQHTCEKLSRLYRAKCRSVCIPHYAKRATVQHRRQYRDTKGEADAQEMEAVLGSHVIHRYPFHDNVQNSLRSEYKILTETNFQVEDVHKCVEVTMLSRETTLAQLWKVNLIEQKCSTLAKMKRIMHVCLLCERCLNNKKRMCVCTRTDSVACKVHGTESVASIDTVGKIVRVRGKQYVFTLCCGSIQEYQGGGSDFCNPHYDTKTQTYFKCSHQRLAAYPTKTSGKTRPECDYCQAPALQYRHVVLDTSTAKLTSICLCQKHTPPPEWLKFVVNKRQFDLTVNAWVQRWLPRP